MRSGPLPPTSVRMPRASNRDETRVTRNTGLAMADTEVLHPNPMGTGACSITAAPGPELPRAIRVPHSR
jgi:hypothetical protein